MSKNAFLILVTMAAVLAAACSTTHIGGIRMSREVTEQFEKLEVKPNYRYWFLNQENNPYGVAGLDREYRLDDDRMWQAVDPDSATFRKVVGSFNRSRCRTPTHRVSPSRTRRGARSGSGTPAFRPASRWIRRPKSFQFPP